MTFSFPNGLVHIVFWCVCPHHHVNVFLRCVRTDLWPLPSLQWPLATLCAPQLSSGPVARHKQNNFIDFISLPYGLSITQHFALPHCIQSTLWFDLLHIGTINGQNRTHMVCLKNNVTVMHMYIDLKLRERERQYKAFCPRTL